MLPLLVNRITFLSLANIIIHTMTASFVNEKIYHLCEDEI